MGMRSFWACDFKVYNNGSVAVLPALPVEAVRATSFSGGIEYLYLYYIYASQGPTYDMIDYRATATLNGLSRTIILNPTTTTTATTSEYFCECKTCVS